MEYTMMVASTRGSVKWAMLGAPAEGTEMDRVTALQIRGPVLHTLSPACRLGPRPSTPCHPMPRSSSQMLPLTRSSLVTPTMG